MKRIAPDLEVNSAIAPFPSKGFWYRLRNTVWAARNQGDVNHITGDVHFLGIGMDPARTILTETERVLELRPHMGSLIEEADELRDRVAASSGPSGAWAMSLTGAELRLLPYLASHLTFPEMASRLFISRNSAKTEAVAIYRKFGVSSRSEAIERAVEVGLLESSVLPPRVDLIQDG